MNESPLSELADGEGNVIGNAKLSVSEAKFKGQMAEGKRQNEGLINVYPNPAKDVLNVDLRDLPNGTYLLNINDGEIHRVAKVVVNR